MIRLQKRKLMLLNNSSLVGYLDSLSDLVYWPLDEQSGTTALAKYNGVLTSAYDAANTNVTVGQTGKGKLEYTYKYDPASDAYTNLYTASLNTFFDGDKGSMFVFWKVDDIGIWSDAGFHAVMSLATSSSVFIKCYISNTGDFVIQRRASGTNDIWNISSLTGSLGWHMTAITWDTSAGATGESYAYLDGAQFGVVETGLGSYVGALSSTLCTLGSDGPALTSEFNGKCAYAGVSDRVLTPTEILNIYQRSGIGY
jgi:hypothetical protein